MPEVTPKTCLIIENESHYRQDLAYELRRNGWRVLGHADRMPDALELARQVSRGTYGPIDVIFMDGNLTKGDTSGKNGWELSALFEQKTRHGTFILPFTRTPENAAWADSPANKDPKVIVRQADALLLGELPTRDVFDVIKK